MMIDVQVNHVAFASKYPDRRMKGIDDMTMTTSTASSSHPVSDVDPLIQAIPSRMLNKYSITGKLSSSHESTSA